MNRNVLSRLCIIILIAITARVDNYIIFGVFTLLGVAGVVTLAFIMPMRRRVSDVRAYLHFSSLSL